MGKEKIKEYLNNKIGFETIMVKNEINSDKELKMYQSILDYIEQLEEREKRVKETLIDKMEKIKRAEKLAKYCIVSKIIIADSDSLNYGRKKAHGYDIGLLNEVLKLYNDKER